MKIGIMSDTHLSANKYTKIDKATGRNRFMVRQFESLEWVLNYFKENGISTIVHGGDVFDSATVPAYPLLKAKELFSDFDVYAIKGNHDDNNFLHRDEISSIDLIGINNYNTPGNVVIGGVNFVMIPWGYPINTSLCSSDMKNVLVAHEFPRDYLGGGSVTGYFNECKDAFDLVITGHYHNIDEFTNGGTRFLNPGSLSAHGNVDTTPSVWVLDTDDLSYERVIIPCAINLKRSEPKDINKYLSEIKTEDIYRIKVDPNADIDRKLLLKTKRVALDLQLQLDASSELKSTKKKVDSFWDYVSKNKKEYLKDFKTAYESIS